jgi:enoyl-CoA hydratase/carnithine racemase
MSENFTPATGLLAQLDLLRIEAAGPVLHVRMNRAAKRNAVNDALLLQLHTCFLNLPEPTRVAVISGEGDHFCAGLDLSELVERDPVAAMAHSRMWHAAFETLQFGRVPIVAALHGAVVGGGLELAASCHLRVADGSAYFGMPEGQRGIFVGGGGSVRISRLIGVARMTDLMLTGRVYSAEEGVQAGIAQYLVPQGQALARALELAQRIASNAGLSNLAVVQALPRIAEQAPAEGLFTEALMAALASSSPEAVERMRAFLEKRASKVVK